MKMLLFCCLAAATIALVACGDDGDKKPTPTAAPKTAAAQSTTSAGTPATGTTPGAATAPATTPTVVAAGTPAAQATKPGARKMYSARPPLTIDPDKKYFATIKMDIGDIRLELFPKEAPQTVNSFVFLARDGYYDGVTFHRVLDGFVAQGGDPTGTGRGGPGYTIPDEVNSHKLLDGTISMATSGPNTAGSQFFICFTPQPRLEASFTAFGQIVSGRDVLDKIAKRDPERLAAGAPAGTAINTIVIEEQ